MGEKGMRGGKKGERAASRSRPVGAAAGSAQKAQLRETQGGEAIPSCVMR